jgi:aspartokinase
LVFDKRGRRGVGLKLSDKKEEEEKERIRRRSVEEAEATKRRGGNRARARLLALGEDISNQATSDFFRRLLISVISISPN